MNETAISSRDNPIFKRLKKLAESARARREARMTLLDGEHLLASYLDAGGQPHTLVRAASFVTGAFKPLAKQDFPLLQGAFMLLAIAVIVANMAADILYTYLDPRVKQV